MAGDFPNITFVIPTGSTNGQNIDLPATTDTTIHTATASAVEFDEINVYVASSDTSNTINLTLKVGGTNNPVIAIDPLAPPTLVYTGRLNNSSTVVLNPSAAGLEAWAKVSHAVNN